MMKEHNNRRIAKLEEMIEERRQLKEAHEEGRRRLSDDDYNKASRQYKNFQRKLEQLKNRSSDVSKVGIIADQSCKHSLTHHATRRSNTLSDLRN